MLNIVLPEKKIMESTSDSVKPNQSSSSKKDMKKKSSAAIRNTNYGLVIRSNDKLGPAVDIKTKKSTEVIVIHERQSHSKNDLNKDSNGKTIQENKEDALLQKKPLSKNGNNDESTGDTKKKSISNAKSTHKKSIESNTSNVLQDNKKIMEDVIVTDAEKNNTIIYSTPMTRSRLRKLLETEHGKNDSDYQIVNSKIITNVQSLPIVGQRKRPGIPPKSAQVKKMKKV